MSDRRSAGHRDSETTQRYADYAPRAGPRSSAPNSALRLAALRVVARSRRSEVVEPAVGPVVVVVDVGGDHLPGLVERLELVAPDAAFLQVAKP